jgi:signal transduction histidine kinase
MKPTTIDGPTVHAPMPAPHSHAHTVQLYDDDAALIERTSGFIWAALGEGGAAVVIASTAHRDGIAASLAASGLDVAEAGAAGRYHAADAAHVLGQIMVAGHVDGDRFEEIVGEPVRRAAELAARTEGPVAVFGELVALLAVNGNHQAAIETEHLWNDLALREAFTLHCGYPMRAFSSPDDGEALARICDAHTAVEPIESYTQLPTHDEQSRHIVLLQQKAHALEQEVAARRRAERALTERHLELQAALVSRERFLALAAHELRTPMTGLRGNAQMLRRNLEAGRSISPERLTRSLGAIESLSLRLDQLITRLLDAGHVEAGTLRVEPVPTDLVALVQSVVARRPFQERHPLDVEGPDRLEAMVDRVRFAQVLASLIDNGVRYSPEGGPVRVAMRGNATDGIEISVTDSGPGIPVDQRDSVFASYRQGGGAVRRSGIGLGLFVSRHIVELHGGSMRIEEPEHRGTRVVITLPPQPPARPHIDLPNDAVDGG